MCVQNSLAGLGGVWLGPMRCQRMRLFMAVPVTPSAVLSDFGSRRYRHFCHLQLSPILGSSPPPWRPYLCHAGLRLCRHIRPLSSQWYFNVNSLPECTGLKSHQAVPVLVPDAELYDRFKEYTKWKKQNVTVVFAHNNLFAQVLQWVLQRHLLAPLPLHARQNSLRYPDLAG